MSPVQGVPATASRVMEALAIYRFLTPEQLSKELGVGAYSYLRQKVLPKLVKQKLIKSINHGPKAGPYSYYLTKKSAKSIATHQGVPLDTVNFPKGNSIDYGNELEHRTAIVSSHISFLKWAESEDLKIDYFHPDFENFKQQGTGGHATSLAQVRCKHVSFLADAIFRFSHKGKHRLCFLEIHHTTTPRNIAKKLDLHVTAIYENVAEKQFQHPTLNFVLSVHWRKSTMETTMKYMMKISDFEEFIPLFHFNTIDQIKQDFSQGWKMANRENSPLFLP